MTRKSILVSTAILVTMASPEVSLSALAADEIRLAQAAAPPADDKDKDKRPPGQRPAQGAPAPGTQQHPPAANAPPGRQAPTTAQPAPQQQQRPGAPPPATAQ